MNQICAGTITLFLVAILWGTGSRKRFPSLKKINSPILPDRSLSLITLVQEFSKIPQNKALPTTNPEIPWQVPLATHERIELQKYLRKCMTSGPEDRLKAIQIANEWGNSSVLPLLLKGLKDSDSQIVEKAAEAMEKFRGKTKADKIQTIRPPRNVALIR